MLVTFRPSALEVMRLTQAVATPVRDSKPRPEPKVWARPSTLQRGQLIDLIV